MEKFTLTVEPRLTIGKAVTALRREGKIPLVLYGHNVESRNLQVDRIAFERVYRGAKGTHLVELTVEGTSVMTLIHETQRHPLSGEFVHADFLQVNMNEVITAEVPIEFVGEAKAVKELGGTLLKNIDAVSVECLPAALPEKIVVDITVLHGFDDTVTVGELVVPAGVKIVDIEPTEVVALVNAPRSDEELAALENAVEENVTAVETVKKPEKEADDADTSDKK
jgi:large subunit ribosomal protein L25